MHTHIHSHIHTCTCVCIRIRMYMDIRTYKYIKHTQITIDHNWCNIARAEHWITPENRHFLLHRRISSIYTIIKSGTLVTTCLAREAPLVGEGGRVGGWVAGWVVAMDDGSRPGVSDTWSSHPQVSVWRNYGSRIQELLAVILLCLLVIMLYCCQRSWEDECAAVAPRFPDTTVN